MMSKKRVFRLISLIMLIIAVIFVTCAISNPQLGRVISIGSFRFGVEQWRICDTISAIGMIGLVCCLILCQRQQNKEVSISVNKSARPMTDELLINKNCGVLLHSPPKGLLKKFLLAT